MNKGAGMTRGRGGFADMKDDVMELEGQLCSKLWEEKLVKG